MQGGPYRQTVSLGNNVHLDANREILIKNNHSISLSRIQFRILYFMTLHIGKPVEEKKLIDYVWGDTEYSSRNCLNVYIHKLRQLLEDDPKRPTRLLSISKVGYILLYPSHH